MLCNRDSTMVTQTWFDCVDDGVGEGKKSDSLPHHHTHTSALFEMSEHTHIHSQNTVSLQEKSDSYSPYASEYDVFKNGG